MDESALFDALPEADVAHALLPYLCDAVGAPGLALVAPLNRLLGGFDTLVYAFELRDPPRALAGPLVLRVYRDARGPERAHREGCVQNAVAALGFPTPRVLLTCLDRSVLGGAFQVMQRLHGHVMLDDFLGPRIVRMPALLAALQVRLHALDPHAFQHHLAAGQCPTDHMSVASDVAAMQARIAAAQLSGLDPGMQWVVENRPSPQTSAVCHGDFHPLNVLLDGRTVSGVLDWAWAKIADPAWDVGATVALITQGPLALPRVLQGIAAAARRWLVGRYVRAYTALRPLDLSAVRYYEALRCLAMLIEAGEYRQAQRGVIPPTPKPTAFKDGRVVGGIIARLRDISGADSSVSGRV